MSHPTRLENTALDRWRDLALRFHIIKFMVAGRRLEADFTTDGLDHLVKHVGISSGENSVMRFLLHTWNGYDNPFSMRDALGWDDHHLAALADWITGKTSGEPLQYF